jgi:hypothetical protein
VRNVVALAAIFAAFATASAGGIRHFNLATTERLGNELSYRDHIAAHTSDLVLSEHPELKKIWRQSWVSELHKDRDVIYWCAQTQNSLVPEYKITYPKDGGVHVEDIHGQRLPERIAIRFKARETAMKAAYPKLNGAYGAHYNFEVIDDPDGSGFLVYGLAATGKTGEILLGGHVRVTVSADGTKAERVDELSKGIMKLDSGPRDAKLDVVGTYDPTSEIPVETYIYSSKLYNMPIFVGPKPGVYWQIWDGKMHKLTKAEIEESKKTEKKK